MISMKARLFGLLLLGTSVVWLSGIAWIYSDSREELERVLDARLDEATRMVGSLIQNADVKLTGEVSGVRVPESAQTPLPPNALQHIETNFKLACQVWSIDGRLVGKSSEAPATQLTHITSGYSNQEINGARWRVYAREDRERGIRILVGDSINHRERLVRDLVWGLAGPGIAVLFALAGLIWIAIGQGLAPLRRLTHALTTRSADELGHVDIGRVPSEIAPVVGALNELFEKVVTAREHERSVTAFAAHELRTPLAGLRTQVQIALAAADPCVRDSALKNALLSADRTTRMVRQLLALAKIDSTDAAPTQEWVDAGARLRAIADELRTEARPNPVNIQRELFGARIKVNPDAFHVAARNLTENALQHTCNNEPVRWLLARGQGEVALVIEDDGPGIPEDEIGLVTKRFYRGRYKFAIGSGLGLSIVETALQKDGLSMRLENRKPEAGLRAKIVIDARRVSLPEPDTGIGGAVGVPVPAAR
jgi:two-component system sensor histidine kinase QseC